MCNQLHDPFGFLLETYQTEVLKTLGIWSAFPETAVDYRPHPKSRSVLEQFEHQVLSEGKWMSGMLGVDTGDPYPAERTPEGYMARYRENAEQRHAILSWKADAWWLEQATFFDTTRSRAWIFNRRLLHSAHHRAELLIYLRMLDVPVPSVYGPTADTDGKVLYQF